MPRGFDSAELARMHDALAGHVERGALPGLISLVAHGGEVHVDVIGTKAVGDRDPMPRDAIFRIASLTKPITGAATMILVDDGVLSLDESIDDLLPELANRRVLRNLDAQLDDTVPAVRPITVFDLLTFRAGFGAVMAPPDTYPIQTAEAALGLRTLGPPWPPTRQTPDQWIGALGTLPLMYQPGEQWTYNTGAQVLGVLIERAAGKPLEVFLRERLFEPLGMTGTAFSVSAEQRDRFTTAYKPDSASGALQVLDGVDDSWWNDPAVFPNAAGWLVSTIDDFWAFVKMLLDKGMVNGERIVSAESVELMTVNHLTREQRDANRQFLGGHGWGFCMQAPAAEAADDPTGPAGFGWDGGTGTTWRTNPDRDLTAMLFTQRAMSSPEPPRLYIDLYKGAYRAIAG